MVCVATKPSSIDCATDAVLRQYSLPPRALRLRPTIRTRRCWATRAGYRASRVCLGVPRHARAWRLRSQSPKGHARRTGRKRGAHLIPRGHRVEIPHRVRHVGCVGPRGRRIACVHVERGPHRCGAAQGHRFADAHGRYPRRDHCANDSRTDRGPDDFARWHSASTTSRPSANHGALANGARFVLAAFSSYNIGMT